MASTKTALKTLSAGKDKIDTASSDWLVDVSQQTCNHDWQWSFAPHVDGEGWYHGAVHCPMCQDTCYRWRAPGVETISRKTWLALVNGSPLTESEGDHE